MVTNYFTLNALAATWNESWRGAVLADAFSQQKDELTLAFATADREMMLRVSVDRRFPFVFRSEGYSRARRNVATLFNVALGQSLIHIRMADRDRMLFLDLADGSFFQIQLFGAQANIFWVKENGEIGEAFQQGSKWIGQAPPAPRPAPALTTVAAFKERWPHDAKTLPQALRRTVPLFGKILAEEILHRAKLSAPNPAEMDDADLTHLFSLCTQIRAELNDPKPHLYWRDREPVCVSLIPLQQEKGTPESFDTVEHAVGVFVRKSLGFQRFQTVYAPLEKQLRRTSERLQHSANQLQEQLAQASRADQYEHWGHLLMAALADVPKQADTVTLPDIFAENAPIAIPLDPQKTAVENAERYYAKARKLRQARDHATGRWADTVAGAEAAAARLAALQTITDFKALTQFQKDHAEAIGAGTSPAKKSAIPFRRFVLPENYEVWVGRNAKQNDLLTFGHARKYDFWLHARGVAGSHVVLRRPHRQAEPPPWLLDQAAGIAAYFSKARGSQLVPVIVAERKYVHKPKGQPPGTVVVQRETVRLVEPALPSS